MTVQPIYSKADYEKALDRIEELWEAPEDSPEGDELEMLSMLVDAYESEHHPVGSPSLIEVCKFRFEQMRKE